MSQHHAKDLEHISDWAPPLKELSAQVEHLGSQLGIIILEDKRIGGEAQGAVGAQRSCLQLGWLGRGRKESEKTSQARQLLLSLKERGKPAGGKKERQSGWWPSLMQRINWKQKIKCHMNRLVLLDLKFSRTHQKGFPEGLMWVLDYWKVCAGRQ